MHTAHAREQGPAPIDVGDDLAAYVAAQRGKALLVIATDVLPVGLTSLCLPVEDADVILVRAAGDPARIQLAALRAVAGLILDPAPRVAPNLIGVRARDVQEALRGRGAGGEG